MSRPDNPLRRRLALVAVWVASTALGGIAVWSAVAQLGDDATANEHTLLSQAQVRDQLAGVRATTTATTGGTTGPNTDPSGPRTTPTPSTTDPTGTATTTQPPDGGSSSEPPPASDPPDRKTRTWSLPGGTVGVACVGSTISQLYATPQDGWTMENSERGPVRVEVEFHNGESESKLDATCVGGVPTGQIETDGESGSDD